MLIKLDFEPAPLLLGFVLGPMLEENLRRAMIISRGDATVFVTHPLSLALLLVSAAAARRRPPAQHPRQTRGSLPGVSAVAKRAELLLVDASLCQRAVLKRMLAANGFTVTAFPDLRKPGAQIVAQRFDHAVLDLRVSDRGGLDSIRSLREARPQARIVVVTDVDSFATVVLALRAGADGFVAKPVDEDELIDALLDRAPPLPPVPQTPLGLHRICWEHIMRVYEQCDRNMTRTAKRLGMDRRSLQRFLS